MRRFFILLSVLFLIPGILNFSATSYVKVEGKVLPIPNPTKLTADGTTEDAKDKLNNIKIKNKDANSQILKDKLAIAEKQLNIIKTKASASQVFLKSLQDNANLLSTLKVERELNEKEKNTLEFILKDIQVK